MRVPTDGKFHGACAGMNFTARASRWRDPVVQNKANLEFVTNASAIRDGQHIGPIGGALGERRGVELRGSGKVGRMLGWDTHGRGDR